MIQQATHGAAEWKSLDFGTAKQVVEETMNGEATQTQMAPSLTGLRMRGESTEETATCVAVIREGALKLVPSFNVTDIMDTGGDEMDTFNISITSAFVITAGGVPVTKRDNRSVPSKNRATDVSEQLGADPTLTAEQSEKLLEEMGMCFMFVQTYHSPMKYAAPIRKGLTIRIIFNILGPLSDPTGATIRLLGVYDKSLVGPLAKVLNSLGVTRGLVVYSADGLDEVIVTGPIYVCEIWFGKSKAYDITPEEVGLSRHELSGIIGGAPEENMQITEDILSGEPKEAKRGIVILSSAISLYLGINDCIIEDCVRGVTELIDSGMAYVKLNEFVSITKTC